MKNIYLLRKFLVFCFFFFAFLTTSNFLFAQTLIPNIRVNDVTTKDQKLSGSGKSIAVLNDTVYVVWEDLRADTPYVYFAKSINKGQTFSSSIMVNKIEKNYASFQPTIAVNKNGHIYIAWANLHKDWTSAYIKMAKSTDGGSTFEEFKVTTDGSEILPCIGVYGDNVYIFYTAITSLPQANYYLIRSTNGGSSFELPLRVNDRECVDLDELQENNKMCIDDYGNIYLVWKDGRRPGSKGDIFFAKSTDGGISITPNVVVNDTTIAAADSAQFFPSIAVGGKDTIYVTWTDKRFGNKWTNWRVCYSVSFDGGVNFVNETVAPITSRSADVVAMKNGLLAIAFQGIDTDSSNVWLAISENAGQDFVGAFPLSDVSNKDSYLVSIIASSDSTIYAVWDQDRNGIDYDIYFTKTIKTTNIKNDDYNNLNSYHLMQNYPNPFNPSTIISFNIPKSEFVTLKIYDILGQEVTTLVNEQLNAGKHSVEFNAGDLRSGVYFYRIQSGAFSDTKKLILIK